MDNPWTILGRRGTVNYPVREFATKREAMRAMEADRAPKTPVVRLSQREYVFTMK